MSERTFKSVLPWLPVAVVAAGAIASGAVDSWRIGAHANEIEALDDKTAENEDDIEEIRRALIVRQGQIELDLQRIESEQRAQGKDLEQILDLLQRLQEAR
jgi:hypothetical protein